MSRLYPTVVVISSNISWYFTCNKFWRSNSVREVLYVFVNEVMWLTIFIQDVLIFQVIVEWRVILMETILINRSHEHEQAAIHC